ncbi:MAG: hypothetical protein ACW96N_01525 [Candidatus Thorarchaeota archaeon]|jgi:hypothetical protein
MKITLQIPEILVASGCGCLIIGSPLLSTGLSIFAALSLITTGLVLRFFSWSLELAKEPKES